MFRLVNVLFSDEFTLRCSSSGDIATRAELDSNSINEKSVFWQNVRATFGEECDDDDKRNKLEFDDVHIFGINPADAKRNLTAKKLFDMWKELNKNYINAQARFSSSGQNENEFWKFVQGDVLYLRKWLQEAELVNIKCRLALDTSELQSAVAVSSATVTPNKQEHEALEMMASAFHTYVTDRRAEANRDQSDDNLQRRSKLLGLMAEVRRQLADVNKKIESCKSTERQMLEEDREILLENVRD